MVTQMQASNLIKMISDRSRDMCFVYMVVQLAGKVQCRVPTDDNVVDPLTKPLPQAKQDRHARFIGIRYIDEWA